MSEHLSNTELKRLHRDWRKKTNNRLALIIDGIQGPYNVGSSYAAQLLKELILHGLVRGLQHQTIRKLGKQLWGLIATSSGLNALMSFKQLKPQSQKDTK